MLHQIVMLGLNKKALKQIEKIVRVATTTSTGLVFGSLCARAP
jgi:hypothetical protein